MADVPPSPPPATPAPTPAPDPYAVRLSIWQRYPHLGWVLVVFPLTAFLTFAAFPPLNIGEAGYGLAAAAVLWAYRRPPFKIFAATVLGAQVLAWLLLLGWLHHVTWAGLVILGVFLGLLTGLWYLAAWWVVGRLRGHMPVARVLVMLGLAGLWVLLEWVRGWIFGGFPWLPLGASQWQRPVLLQVAAYAGTGAISFVLAMFNLGVAAFAHRIFFEGMRGLKRRSPEFMAALLVLSGGTFPFIADMMGQQRHRLARVAIVQPDIPQNEKWDESRAREILQVLEDLTTQATSVGSPDLVVWPEAVTPWALGGDPGVRPWLESLAQRGKRPLLLGSIRTEAAADGTETWHNGAFLVDPRTGLELPGYTKRKLVPFGEFIPLRPVFGWLEKFVPIGGDFTPGESAAPLLVPVGRERVPVGTLICFEDIFPSLARFSALEGAELLAVLTNNGWFGEGGAAWQHAVHSALRAVETRRPVLRCGNAGWSGWFDEYGYIRGQVTDADGGIYFRGVRTLDVTRDVRWSGRQSFYTLRGDWFLAVAAALALSGGWYLLAVKPPPPRDGEPVF